MAGFNLYEQFLQNGVHGFVETNPDELMDAMQLLLDNPTATEARRMGDNTRELALRDFGLSRFVNGWNAVFAELTQEVMR